MACNCDISIGYTIIVGKVSVNISPFSIFPAGIINGKSYYVWTDTATATNFTMSWNPGTNQWEVYEDSEGILYAYLPYTGDCPGDIEEENVWFINEEFSTITYLVSFVNNCAEPSPTEEDPEECFEILVWNKQCAFSKCVLKYLQLLKFGVQDCTALEDLKNQKRTLEILNRYDTNDIPYDTTEHNDITYSEIKKLLN
jgi:hypothetical protein